MKRFRRFLVAVVAALLVSALLGYWVSRNRYVTHNPTVFVGQYLRATGEWPKSWEAMEAAGFAKPMNHDLVSVAWDIDPYDLLQRGRIVGEVPFMESSCSVVYEIKKLPSGEVDWLLHPILVDAMREVEARIGGF